ncbi:MAG: HAD-IA family hydrolase [Planctomycetota bacterium]|jgi:2-haloacid dehalogenase
MGLCSRLGRRTKLDSFDEVLKRTQVITFDCYGTLIDWSTGLRQSFEAMFGGAIEGRWDEMVKAYVAIEAGVEAEPYQSYRDILAKTAERLAKRFDLELDADRANVLVDMLPQWKPFPDTNDALTRLKRRYRLGVLSNIDRDLFAGTARQFDVAFDFVVTAEDVRSYKPGLGHFRRLLDEHADRETVLHVAQSLYHDGVPTGQLGIAYVWINRYNDVNELSVKPLAAYTDLKSLADRACET